jgi:DNA-binding transcriptional regulator YbjK
VETRQERILDAAIEILGARGPRHLTHRAVDAVAGLPLGSTSNRYRSRGALIVGVLHRILELDAAAWWTVAIGLRPRSVSALAGVIGQLLRDLVETDRTRSLARRAAFLEAAREPELREEIRRAQEEITTWLAPALAQLGSRDPAGHVRHLLALMDGLVGHQLVNPRPDFDPSGAVEALLRGLIDADRDATAGTPKSSSTPSEPEDPDVVAAS